MNSESIFDHQQQQQSHEQILIDRIADISNSITSLQTALVAFQTTTNSLPTTSTFSLSPSHAFTTQTNVCMGGLAILNQFNFEFRQKVQEYQNHQQIQQIQQIQHYQHQQPLQQQLQLQQLLQQQHQSGQQQPINNQYTPSISLQSPLTLSSTSIQTRNNNPIQQSIAVQHPPPQHYEQPQQPQQSQQSQQSQPPQQSQHHQHHQPQFQQFAPQQPPQQQHQQQHNPQQQHQQQQHNQQQQQHNHQQQQQQQQKSNSHTMDDIDSTDPYTVLLSYYNQSPTPLEIQQDHTNSNIVTTSGSIIDSESSQTELYTLTPFFHFQQHNNEQQDNNEQQQNHQQAPVPTQHQNNNSHNNLDTTNIATQVNQFQPLQSITNSINPIVPQHQAPFQTTTPTTSLHQTSLPIALQQQQPSTQQTSQQQQLQQPIILTEDEKKRITIQNILNANEKSMLHLKHVPISFQFENVHDLKCSCLFLTNGTLTSILYCIRAHLPLKLSPYHDNFIDSKLWLSSQSVLNGEWIQIQGDGSLIDSAIQKIFGFIKHGDDHIDNVGSGCGCGAKVPSPPTRRFLIKIKWD